MGSPVRAPIRVGNTTAGSSSLANTAYTGTEAERSTSEGSGVPAAHNRGPGSGTTIAYAKFAVRLAHGLPVRLRREQRVVAAYENGLIA
jgi:hypothetical protein